MFAGVALALGAMVATVVLLALGMAIGYRFGSQNTVAVTLPDSHLHKTGPGLALNVSLENGETMQACMRIALEAAARHRVNTPPELMRALDQLIEATQRLSTQLAKGHDLPPRREATPSAQKPEAQPLLIQSREDDQPFPSAGLSRALPKAGENMLSAEEMQQLTSSSCEFTIDDSPKRRYAFDAQQRVVPIEAATRRPCLEQAATVRCHDISGQGISFFWPDDPDFDQLVISLGSEGRPIWMNAEVMQSKAVFMHGEIQTLVGCRFMGRLQGLERSQLSFGVAANCNELDDSPVLA
jgi:hypothetical protein